MKTILSNPASRKLVSDYIADPRAEFPHNAQGQAHGFTQKQQSVLIVRLLLEEVFTDYSDDTAAFAKALVIVEQLANGSAARQVMEKAGLLAESSRGSRLANDAASYAAKWCAPLAKSETPAA